jgi:hypothetical protein
MKLLRTELVPVLVVIGGAAAGVIGFGTIVRGNSPDDVPAVTRQLLDENGTLRAGVTGTWVLSVSLVTGTGDATFVLEQEGSTITGTYTGTMGRRLAVTGTEEDGLVKLFFASEEGLVSYEGRIEGITMEGTCVYGDRGEGTFRGRIRA